MSRPKRYLLLAALLTVAVVGFVVWFSVFHLRNFSTVESGVLYRSGQLSETGLKYAIALYGIKTVVTLRADSDPTKPNLDDWEEELCVAKGVRYIHLAPRAWNVDDHGELPAEKMVTEFLTIMDDPSNFPVLIHCFAGVHRTGTLSAIYRLEYQHWNADRTVADMEAHGFLPGRNREAIEKFLRTYQPRR
jgi:tyrosine-protein phosphatase SIW14